MTRLTIYERLKPEIKEALQSPDNDQYRSSVDSIIETLSNTRFYMDLKISDVRALYTFANIDSLRVSTWDFKYGDNILIQETNE